MPCSFQANQEQEAATAVPEVNGIVPGQEWERVSKHCDFSAKVQIGFVKVANRICDVYVFRRQATLRTCLG
jgi:hypothetical protein